MLMRSPLARERRSSAGFIRPAQPVLADRPPSGSGWSFEIKHDGFRIVSRKDRDGLRLWSRNARDWSVEFRAIAEALKALPVSGVWGSPEAQRWRESAQTLGISLVPWELESPPSRV